MIALLSARVVDCLHPVDALETLRRVATELQSYCPISSRRIEEAPVIRADFLPLRETIVGVRTVATGREDASFACLDGLASLFVLHNDFVRRILDRSRRRRIDRDAKRKAVGPLTIVERARIWSARTRNRSNQKKPESSFHYA